MFIFLSLPSGNDQPHSNYERKTLEVYQTLLSNSLAELNKSEYLLGYGNITGYQLSYEDHLQHKKVKDWPFRHYDKDHPWKENQEDSILPNFVSEKVRLFWGRDYASKEGDAYLLNISGRADGDFIPIKSEVKAVDLVIPKYLRQYYDSRSNFDDDDDDDNSNNNNNNNIDDDDNTDARSSSVKSGNGEAPDGRYIRRSDSEIGAGKENLAASSMAVNEQYPRVGNITKEGLISVVVKGYQYNYNEPDFKVVNESEKVGDAIVADLLLTLKDYLEVEDHLLQLSGVYFQNTGSLVATTNSAKFFGSYGLSHLVMNEDKFQTAKTLMKQFNNIKNDKEVTLDDMNSSILKSMDQCEFVTFIQFNKTGFSHDELRYIDNELKHPTGSPLPHELPQLSIGEIMVYSPDCGVVLTKRPQTPFVGRKSEVLRAQMKNVLTGLLVLVCAQLYLIFKQVNLVRTPGQLSVISSKTLFLLGFEDSLLALMSLLLSTVTEDLYLLLACIATIAFMLCGIFEMRFMVSVLTTQANERGTTWWEIMRGASNIPSESRTGGESVAEAENSEGPILPIANTPTATAAQQQQQQQQPLQQPQQNEPVPDQAWQETSYSNSIFASGFTFTIIAMFLIFSSLSWRLRYRIVFEYMCLIFINSFWIPQFLRNTLKNRRKAFNWQFVFGSSIIRVLPLYYFALYKGNPLRHRYDPTLCIVVTIWMVIQLFLLVLQNVFGARFWINESWLPKAYDYQPVLTLRNLKEDGFSSDLLASFKQKVTTSAASTAADATSPQTYVECECTCPICMAEVTLPIIMKDEVEESSKRKVHIPSGVKKEYMVTPCHHIFHVECLESWMKYKLQCPVCRTSLPPI